MPARGQGSAYQGAHWIRESTRYAIYYRDRDPKTGHFLCAWCLRRVWPWNPTRKVARRICLDHLVPVHMGGTNRSENVVTSCHLCNNQRRGQSWEDWRDSCNCDPLIESRILERITRPLTKEERRAGLELSKARKKGPRTWKSLMSHWSNNSS
jgi:hypothetical protein